MLNIGHCFLLLGLTICSLSTNVRITVINRHEETPWNLSNCTSDASSCSLELNELGAMLSDFSSLKILFEESLDAFPLYSALVFLNYTRLELHGASDGKTVVNCLHQNKTSSGVGLTFTNVSNFIATNITFKACGYQYNLTKTIETGKILWNALAFENCENVQLINVIVQESAGFGVSMFDVTGNVHFNNCLFHNNSAILGDIDTGGGGVYLEMTSNSLLMKNSRGVFKLLKCNFTDNKAHTSNVYPGKNEVRTFGQGGGLLISFKGNASGHHFSILHCTFRRNSAVWGGGLHLFLTDSSHNNVISIEHSLFEGNKASAGGGGMVVYMLSHSSCITENNVSVFSTNFIENLAESQGGGTIIHSLHTDHAVAGSCDTARGLDYVRGINHLRFESCNWCENGAGYSGAIDVTTRTTITESFLIEPVFSNCSFEKNTILNKSLAEGNSISQYKESMIGKAAFMVLGSVIKFENRVYFKGNIHTALYAVASKIEFASSTNATFYKNRGKNGGAIALIGSTLHLGDHSFLNFTRNRAYELGGAIYSETQGEHELHQNIPGLNCFIHCIHCETVTLSFTNNSANLLENDNLGYSFGRAIFATSILSCVSDETATEITNITANVSALLQRIANFNFVGTNPYDQVVTSAAKFTLFKPPNDLIIPGKDFNVPLVTTDYFGHKIQSDYKAFLRYQACKNGSITIDPKHTYLPTNKLRLFGDPGTKCNISIEKEGSRLFYLTFRITMAQCPPGFILTENEGVNSGKYSKMDCVCAQQLVNGTENYRGISSCNDRSYKAKVVHHFWVGYESDNASHENLITAYCPRSFCSYNSSSYAHEHVLPSNANRSDLDKFICSNGRTGKICGSCQVNYSVYFHSPNYLCKENHLCSVGWLFYLISEIFILIVLFTVILCFNISFTSGTLNGFILYAQTIDILSVSAMNHHNAHSTWTIFTTKASIFFYHFFNLDFFNLDELSFCLWEGATTLDIITMKYLTIVLAFALVISVFVFMNLCTYRNLKYYPKFKKLQLRQSVIHGISTFLVICFAQTVKVSFRIFTPGFVMRRGDRIASYQVLYDGDVQLFGSEHLKYVIPGLVLFISIVIIPTFFLMCYPLGSKALSKCGVSENKITKLNQIFCITRLRPLFDSFQGCYKDKYRCFAGLYFIYRTSILASSSYSYGAIQFYVLVQIQLSLMLLVHCLAHPYIRQIHNTLDTLLFTNIAVINGLSIFLHTKSKQPLYLTSVNVASAFQTFLIGLPLMILLLYMVTMIVSKLKLCHKREAVVEIIQKNPVEEDIPFRLLYEGQEAIDNDLCEF